MQMGSVYTVNVPLQCRRIVFTYIKMEHRRVSIAPYLQTLLLCVAT